MSSGLVNRGHEHRRSWRLELRLALVFLAVYFCSATFVGCSSQVADPNLQENISSRLRPVTTPLAEHGVRRTVYVPVYSSIYLGLDIKKAMVDLTATVSVRNVSSRYPVVLEFARYYDSAGNRVRDYINTPSELPALATVEFVVRQADTAGGPGANFLIRWTGPAGVDEPLMEAVMVGRSGNAGISFVSAGRTVRNETPR